MHLNMEKQILCNFLSPVLCRYQETTHLELKQTSMLSAIASLTPYSDFNQSPRNMYQCQVTTAFNGRCSISSVSSCSVKCIMCMYCIVSSSLSSMFIYVLFRWENKRWEHQLRHWNTVVITNCTGYRWGGISLGFTCADLLELIRAMVWLFPHLLVATSFRFEFCLALSRPAF